MRTGMYTIFAAHCLTLCQPGAAGDSDPAALTRLLEGWERKSRQFTQLRGEFTVETFDTVFREKTKEYGKAWALKPFSGRLDLSDEKGNRRIFVATKTAVHQYEFGSKQEIVHELPKYNQGQQQLPGPLTFVFGMSAQEAKQRYLLNLYQQTDDYAWLEIQPRRSADQRDFARAKLVFDRKTHMPMQMLIIQPNGVQQRWIFSRLETNLDTQFTLRAKDLSPFTIPRNKGWKREVIPWGEKETQMSTNPLSAPGRSRQ